MRVVRVAAGFLLAASLAAGCGGPKAGEVSGTVRYDGKPVEQGSIAFVPADGNGPSTGGEIADGKYSVPNVPAGTAKVIIHADKGGENKIIYDNPAKPVVKAATGELLPDKYHEATELRYDVQPGSQTKDFDLPK